jgi:uncharacterized Zn finger protein
MNDINHKKSAKCPRDGSRDIEAIESSGNNYTLRCKHCGYLWTESCHPSMTKDD